MGSDGPGNIRSSSVILSCMLAFYQQSINVILFSYKNPDDGAKMSVFTNRRFRSKHLINFYLTKTI